MKLDKLEILSFRRMKNKNEIVVSYVLLLEPLVGSTLFIFVARIL